jgi:hypothetical protein
MIVRDCSQWLGEVHEAMPSVLLAARDERGRDLFDVTVTVDAVSVPLDGRPLALDPGKHVVEFRRSALPPVTEVLVLNEGEKARPVVGTFPSVVAPRGDATPAPEPHRGLSAPTIVLSGIGLAALGGFAYFGVAGVRDRSAAGCDRGCSDADFARVNRQFVAADIALGVAIASLGGALVWWLTHPAAPSTEKR